MKLRTTFVFLLLICLSLTQIVPVSANQANDSPFVPYSRKISEEYRLVKYDVLDIVILELSNADMFSNIMIGVDGFVNLPYIGSLKLEGLTVEEATAVLTEKIGEYIKITQLSVMIKSYGPRQVYVMGAVKNQGIYNLGQTYLNIFAAISSAGGIAPKGRSKHVAVIRMIEDEMHMREINLDKFIKEQDASQNISLQDGDLIYVPESNKILLYEDIMPIATAVGIIKSITR